MSFLEIEKGKFGGLETVSNRAAVSVYKPCAKIGVSGDIYKKLGSPTYFKLMLGTGAHSGFVALIPRNMPSASSYKINGNNKSSFEIAVSPKKIGITSDRRGLTPVPFEITEDGLILDIRPLRTPILSVAAE
jgi:hypothetical protein